MSEASVNNDFAGIEDRPIGNQISMGFSFKGYFSNIIPQQTHYPFYLYRHHEFRLILLYKAF